MSYIFKLFYSMSVIVFSLLLISCEDDAILAPQPESECNPATDSYCKLSLPGSGEDDDKAIKNPSTY